MSRVTPPSHDGGNSARHSPAPAIHPTLQASRTLLLWDSPGAVASLMRDMEHSWSFKGGTVCGDSWLSVIPSRYAQPTRAWAGGCGAQGWIPPRASSCPLGQSLHDKAKLDRKAVHGPRTSAHCILCFIRSAMGPDGYAGHQDAGTPSCVSSQPNNTSRIRATLHQAPTTCQTPCWSFLTHNLMGEQLSSLYRLGNEAPRY